MLSEDWISVKDRMPEVGVPVLVYFRICKIPLIAQLGERMSESWLTAYWTQAGRGALAHPYDKNGKPSAKAVSHWMPLPPPPAEKGKS